MSKLIRIGDDNLVRLEERYGPTRKKGDLVEALLNDIEGRKSSKHRLNAFDPKPKKVDPPFTSNLDGEKVAPWQRVYRCVMCDDRVTKLRMTAHDGTCRYCEMDMAMNPEFSITDES